MGELIPILGIVFGCSIPLLVIWTKHQQKIVESQANVTAEKAAQYASNVSDLEQRVQVLERIVTDRGYDVATQIEALRDTREVEQSDSGTPLNIAKGEHV